MLRRVSLKKKKKKNCRGHKSQETDCGSASTTSVAYEESFTHVHFIIPSTKLDTLMLVQHFCHLSLHSKHHAFGFRTGTGQEKASVKGLKLVKPGKNYHTT